MTATNSDIRGLGWFALAEATLERDGVFVSIAEKAKGPKQLTLTM